MRRPYSEEQVFELEMASADIVRRLHDPYGLPVYRRLDEETFECIVYDAMIALREAMIDEEEV
jgi:hypothetical protein